MNNVKSINADIEFKPGSLKQLSALVQQAGSQLAEASALYIETQYLPYVVNKIESTYHDLQRFERQLRNAKVTLPIKIAYAINNLEALVRELRGSNVSARQSAIEEVEDILDELLLELEEHKDKLKRKANSARDRADAISMAESLVQLEKNIEADESILDGLDEQLKELRTNRHVLTEAINAVERLDALDITFDTLLTLTSLHQAGVPPTQAAVIEQGAELVKKLLGGIQSEIKWGELVRQRNRLNQRIEQALTRRQTNDEGIKHATKCIQLINRVVEYDDLKAEAIEQGAGTKEALRHVVLSGRQSSPETANDVRGLISIIRQLQTYMTRLS